MEKYEEGMTDELLDQPSLQIYQYQGDLYRDRREELRDIECQHSQEKNVSDHPRLLAAGGVGKTTVALGLAGCLTGNYKKVLYIDAERMQVFQHHLNNSGPVLAQDVYMHLADPKDSVYQEISHVIPQGEIQLSSAL